MIHYLFQKLVQRGQSGLRSFGLYPSHRSFIFDLIQKGSICAEIGVWKGDFSEEILRRNKPSKLYLIDPWKFQEDFSERMFGGAVAKSQVDMDRIFCLVKQRLQKYSQVEYLRFFSNEAACYISDNSLDWLYIDGNHYKDFVLQDLELYTPKVKVGGYICGDDYNWRPNKTGNLEVKEAVNYFLKKNDNVELVVVKNGQFVLRRTK